MNRKAGHSADMPGQDSFLDVIANLVGILIILVMVVGVRAKDALLEAAPPSDVETSATDGAFDLDSAQAAAKSVEEDIHRLSGNVGRQDLEIAYRREERDRVQLLIAAGEEAIAKQREQLDAAQRAKFDTQRELMATHAELQDLKLGRETLENSMAQTGIIEHLPTPMAKTVFGRELHVRLSRGRLLHVPWEDLVELLQEEVPSKVWRLKDEPQIVETIGPIGGFWMKYTLVRSEVVLPGRGGVSVQSRVELDHFLLIPVSENLGEALDEALQPGSRFRSLLDEHRPDETTVTVWVYPDSYGQFRSLKRTLFELGYLTASRPLPEGQPIGGSPRGTRSAAE